MKGIILIALICGLILFSGCTQQAPSAANTTNVTSTTIINATCSDGTLEKTCSANKPFYCAGGELIKNVDKCGCASGSTLSGGSCVKLCSDGTLSGQCTTDKSRYCSDGILVIDNTKCGCNSSNYDLKDGNCVLARCDDNTTLNACSASVSFLCNANGNLVKNPERCGCPTGYTASGNDCLKDCSDGTLPGQCNNASKLCNNGTLVLNVTECSCPSGKIACGNSCIVSNCTSDSDCYDGNSNTSDKCLSPRACNATCSNEYYTALIYDNDDNPTMHNLKFNINNFEDIGRNLSYTSNNGTDLVLASSSSSKKFIEVSVSIEAKKDYDYEISQDSFYLIDEDNISYNPVCPSKSNKSTSSYSSCYNEGAFDSYDSLAEDDIAEGYLYFEIPKSNDPMYFAFQFDDSLKPREIWFRYD